MWWSRGWWREQGREKVSAVAVWRQGRRRPPRLPRRDVACRPPAGNTRRRRTLQRGGSSSATGLGASPDSVATGPAGLGRTAPLLQPPAAARPRHLCSSTAPPSLRHPPGRRDRGAAPPPRLQALLIRLSSIQSAADGAPPWLPPPEGGGGRGSTMAPSARGRRRTGLCHGSLRPEVALLPPPPSRRRRGWRPDRVGSELERVGGRRREEVGEGGWPSPAAGAGRLGRRREQGRGRRAMVQGRKGGWGR
jgi:hypothetical protein